MWKLVTELSGTVIHEGTYEECELILDAFGKYGLDVLKFEIVPEVKLPRGFTVR